MIIVFQGSSCSWRGIQFWQRCWKFSAKIPKVNRSMPKKSKVSVSLYLFNKISNFFSGHLQIIFPGSLTLVKTFRQKPRNFLLRGQKHFENKECPREKSLQFFLVARSNLVLTKLSKKFYRKDKKFLLTERNSSKNIAFFRKFFLQILSLIK